MASLRSSARFSPEASREASAGSYDGECRATRKLGRIERAVGLLQQKTVSSMLPSLRVIVGTGADGHDLAVVARSGWGMASAFHALAEDFGQFAQALRGSLSSSGSRILRRHGARKGAKLLGLLRKQPCQRDEAFVARMVAEAVVEALEIVDVDQNQADLLVFCQPLRVRFRKSADGAAVCAGR